MRTRVGGGLGAGAALCGLILAAPTGGLQERGTYRGHYISGFESSEFLPCASRFADESWWLTADSAGYVALRRDVGRPTWENEAGWGYSRAFVRVRGAITDTGRYGHLGAFDRELTVDTVLGVVHPDSADCPGRRFAVGRPSARAGSANIRATGRYALPSP